MENEDEVFDPSIYVVGFEKASLREPTNLEIAEYIDLNNMMWFAGTKCLLIDRDILHEPDELMEAQAEARVAQRLVLDWWQKMMIPEGKEDVE